MKLRTSLYAFFASTILLPALALAQGNEVTPTGTGFGATIQRIANFLNDIIVFLFLIATVVFLFGVIRYVTAGGDEDKVKEGRSMMINGIIALAVMIALWAFVNVALTFFFDEGTDIGVPGPTEVPQSGFTPSDGT